MTDDYPPITTPPRIFAAARRFKAIELIRERDRVQAWDDFRADWALALEAKGVRPIGEVRERTYRDPDTWEVWLSIEVDAEHTPEPAP